MLKWIRAWISGRKQRVQINGKKQRLVIAKAFAKDSRIIVADEPTANLDKENGEMVIKLLHELSKTTLVFIVTHNYQEVENYITRNIELRDGKVVKDTQLNTRNDLIEPKEVADEKAGRRTRTR